MEGLTSTSPARPEGAPVGSVAVTVSDDPTKLAWVSGDEARKLAIGERSSVTLADDEFMTNK